jgi:hypothetical protein
MRRRSGRFRCVRTLGFACFAQRNYLISGVFFEWSSPRRSQSQSTLATSAARWQCMPFGQKKSPSGVSRAGFYLIILGFEF